MNTYWILSFFFYYNVNSAFIYRILFFTLQKYIQMTKFYFFAHNFPMIYYGLFEEQYSRIMRIKYHGGFSNLHLFKQINIYLIFTDCILYLLHRGCTFSIREIYASRNASYCFDKLLQSGTGWMRERERES